jgi:lysophospholipase L1-like esterase
MQVVCEKASSAQQANQSHCPLPSLEFFAFARGNFAVKVSRMKVTTRFFSVALGLAAALLLPARAPAAPARTTVLFLGDSITYGGQFIEYFAAGLRIFSPTNELEILNLGLPSETVSGLSEPGHAGGQFPRPDLHERLDRVLAKTKPKIIIACYGMNDGIYYPLSPDRLAKFTNGILWLHQKAAQAGARIIHLTPPVFDAVPLKGRTLPAGRDAYPQPYEGYDEVLKHYSEWLLAQRAQGWEVVDIHGPIVEFLAERRRTAPDFRLAGDGVHPNSLGHWMMARQLLVAWGAPPEVAKMDDLQAMLARHPHGQEILKLVEQEQRVLKDAWLTETGHQRPGMGKGLPFAEAQAKVEAIEAKLRGL